MDVIAFTVLSLIKLLRGCFFAVLGEFDEEEEKEQA